MYCCRVYVENLLLVFFICLFALILLMLLWTFARSRSSKMNSPLQLLCLSSGIFPFHCEGWIWESPSACSSHCWARFKSGARNSIQVFHVGGRHRSIWAITFLFTQQQEAGWRMESDWKSLALQLCPQMHAAPLEFLIQVPDIKIFHLIV